MSRPRVMISINTSWNILNFRANLIRAIIDAGYDVVAASPLDAWSGRLTDIGCTYVDLPIDSGGTSPIRDMGLIVRYWHLLVRERPVAFLGYTIKPNIFGSLAAQSLKIPTINNISGLGTSFIRKSWLTSLVKLLYRVALGRSARVFFQNRDDRDLFIAEQLVPAARTEVLPGSGIDLTRFTPSPLPAAPEGPVFLLIGRLLGDKGINEYVEAARMVRRVHPGVRFQLLGYLDVDNATAISRQDVEAWVKEGVIEYLGDTDDVRPFIAAADCVVLPSYREGTPRTLLEAAAMARPIVATNVPGCRDLVDAGQNGFLCEARDAAGLASALQRVIALPASHRSAMGASSRALVEARYDEAIVIDRYLRAIASVAPLSAR